jgi:transposase
MLSLPPSTRIFFCQVPTDMRRSFDSLSRMASEVCGESPFSGHLFVFCNRARDRLKILYWDVDGYALWYKRLEKGYFRFPAASEDRIEMSSEELWGILSGIDIHSAKRQKRYRRPENTVNSSP